MSCVVITGSAGLIGSEAARFFAGLGMDVLGVDNDMRKQFFGEEASTAWVRRSLEQEISRYRHFDLDVRDSDGLLRVFQTYGRDIDLVIHTAGQPSHDWAARDPLTDFSVNATGTLNVLEATRTCCPDAPFLFTSSNKVYGDLPNTLPLRETATRWEIDPEHPYAAGIPEQMSIDQSKHTLMGASKVAADILVQEYARYFGMKTACFRGGCLTGPHHAGTRLHGFLAYLMKCTVTRTPYTVFGYRAKQVRDNIHSSDLITAFYEFYQAPRRGEVYNIGGGRDSHCSMLEAIHLCQEIAGQELQWTYSEEPRIGDHLWYVSDLTKFKSHYPSWKITFDIPSILNDLYARGSTRWKNDNRQ